MQIVAVIQVYLVLQTHLCAIIANHYLLEQQ